MEQKLLINVIPKETNKRNKFFYLKKQIAIHCEQNEHDMEQKYCGNNFLEIRGKIFLNKGTKCYT
jgi:hypothetical protein